MGVTLECVTDTLTRNGKLELKSCYTKTELAKLVEVSVRTIQRWVSDSGYQYNKRVPTDACIKILRNHL